MDPVSLLAAASTAYAAIKQGIAIGKELNAMAHDLSKLWESVGKLTQLAAEPPKSVFGNQQSYEAKAIELYAAKAKAHEMALEIRGVFIRQYGLDAWDSIQRTVAELRRQAAIARAEEEQRIAHRNEMIAQFLMGSSLVLGAGVLILIIFGLIALNLRG